jgi:hypothetical protein
MIAARDIEAVADEIAGKFNPQRIYLFYLFGSYAN